MKEISSVHNEHIKELIHLQDTKGRRQQDRFIAEGLRTIRTFLKAGYVPQEVFVTKDTLEDAQSIGFYDRTILASQSVIKKLSYSITPSGILAVFSLPHTPAPENLTSGLVLAQLQEPGNMGTLIRTAAAVGARSVVVIEGTDPWSQKVVAASAGTLAEVTLFTWSWDMLQQFKGKHTLYGLVVADGKPLGYPDARSSLLVVGNEAHGLPSHWQRDCDELITLPMPGGTESLNAAIAGSIALYLTFVGR
jgi:RNA methyltransferase, TrmH family